MDLFDRVASHRALQMHHFTSHRSHLRYQPDVWKSWNICTIGNWKFIAFRFARHIHTIQTTHSTVRSWMGDPFHVPAARIQNRNLRRSRSRNRIIYSFECIGHDSVLICIGHKWRSHTFRPQFTRRRSSILNGPLWARANPPRVHHQMCLFIWTEWRRLCGCGHFTSPLPHYEHRPTIGSTIALPSAQTSPGSHTGINHVP